MKGNHPNKNKEREREREEVRRGYREEGVQRRAPRQDER